MSRCCAGYSRTTGSRQCDGGLNMESKRPYVAYFDLLRVVAIFTVVAVHLSAQHWPDVDVHSRAWFAFNLYCSLGKWSVPIFVMISGALFLGRDTDVHP